MRKGIVLTTAVLFVAAAAACPSPAVAKSKKNTSTVSEISVTKQTDKASPTLMRSTTAPRDVATGQATGRRMHKPY
jgi:type VI protein secretion system component Hcp